jgi:hypothetical protein
MVVRGGEAVCHERGTPARQVVVLQPLPTKKEQIEGAQIKAIKEQRLDSTLRNDGSLFTKAREMSSS